MLEALVVGGIQEDLGLQAAPSVAIVHDLPAARLVAAAVQRCADIVHRHIRKWCSVTLLPHTCCNLHAPSGLMELYALLLHS